MSLRSSRLNGKIAFLQPEMQAAAKRLWTHDRFSELFPEYLCALHTTIRASVPILQLGQERCRALADSDPVCQVLADYFAEHAEEEQQHDVWLLEDIETLGIDPASVLQRVPTSTAASLVGSQYYWIQNYHPIALLGYLAVLERPVDPQYFLKLSQKWNIPESAFRTILLHAELDGDHREDLDRLVDSLDLTPAQESMLGTSAIATAGQTALFFTEIVDRFERTS